MVEHGITMRDSGRALLVWAHRRTRLIGIVGGIRIQESEVKF